MSYIRIPGKSEGALPSIPSVTEVETRAPIEVTTWKCRNQVIGSLIVCIGLFAVGTVFGWGSVAVTELMAKGKLPPGEGSEAAATSLFIIGALFAGPVAGYSMYKLGRQRATFLFSVVFSIGWIFIPTAELVNNVNASATMIYIGRVITGFAGAGFLVIGPVYVRELCDEKIRAAMGSLVPLVTVLGYSLCLTLGSCGVNWWVLSIVAMMFPVASCGLILIVPDTPRHLLTVGEEAKAKESSNWLTIGFEPEERERMFKRVKRGVEFLDRNCNRAMTRSERKKKEKRLGLSWKSRPVAHPLIISNLLMFFQQASGINVISVYTVEILRLGKHLVPIEAGINIYLVCYFFATITATVIVNRLGRKPLLLVGTVAQCLIQIILGAYFYSYYNYQKKNDTESINFLQVNFSWIPVFCTSLFIIFYATSLGSVSWILMTEINHPDFQELAGTLNCTTYWLTAFISMFTLPSLRESIEYHACFWLYSVIAFCSFWYCFFFIYETKGKTQEQIMAHYKGYVKLDGIDEDEESKSLGSLAQQKKHPHHHHKRKSGSSSEGDRRFSAGSDWSTDMETLYEADTDEITK